MEGSGGVLESSGGGVVMITGGVLESSGGGVVMITGGTAGNGSSHIDDSKESSASISALAVLSFLSSLLTFLFSAHLSFAIPRMSFSLTSTLRLMLPKSVITSSV